MTQEKEKNKIKGRADGDAARNNRGVKQNPTEIVEAPAEGRKVWGTKGLVIDCESTYCVIDKGEGCEEGEEKICGSEGG